MVEGQDGGWNDATGAVTRAFDDWRRTDSDIRAFLTLTTRWMEERYQQIWDDLSEQPGWDDGPELPDLFYRAVDGLEPLDYHWMLQAAVLRDAVSAFEVYLDKVGDEVLRRHGYTWKVKLGRSPEWLDMVPFFSDQLGVQVDTGPVQHIRQLRHILTHLRGELRTTRQRERFGQNDYSAFPGYRVELSVKTVTRALDELAGLILKVDPAAWRVTHGDDRLELS